ncbi:MAG: SRPBCC domain-containing protein [Pseudomonadales bacterium]|nr:SRPBCC domain-containing protein [Pseudomonadales bacterium]
MRRVYNASIEDVFDAWIETSKIKQWWGCAECTNVESEVEPKLGGKYNHHMTIENEYGKFDDTNFASLIEYDPPNRLAYTSNDESDPMVITVSFRTVESGTEVLLVQTNIPDIQVDGDIELCVIVQGGWTAGFEKLGTFLAGSSTP